MSAGDDPPDGAGDEAPAPYRIEVARPAAKALAKVPQPDRGRIVAKIDALAADPRPPGVEAIQGSDDPLFRVRVGSYRVVYEVRDDVLLVLVLRVGHRRDVYRGL